MMEESVDVQEVDPQAEMLAAGRSVLQAGRWLMLNGWGNMLMLPYIAPSGYWRCAFHPLSKPSREFYRYSSSSVFRFLENHCGGSVRRNIKAEQLAQAIVKSVPEEVREQCQGRCPPALQHWLDAVEVQLQRDVLPAAFDEYTEDHSQWRLWATGGQLGETLPPPPGYVVPGTEPQWHEQPFWRGAVDQARLLQDEEEFLLSLRHAKDFDQVAHELAIVMREGGTSVASVALRAAIAKLA